MLRLQEQARRLPDAVSVSGSDTCEARDEDEEVEGKEELVEAASGRVGE